ncbi:DUF3307 domain-containing protein [Nocardiopsis sp. Huas11]|uniref:DUF3307 domain-containing protein n=1 Tax=Nocardiopsis sp. Huas11 TaxID=2183912 RepID=UPI0018F40E4F|nr:DUF3307 domain-containing protein [Nocardiopsis sp. Huas11]
MTAFVALFVGHWLGDHWAQTGHQVAAKGRCDAAGRRACAAHVATLTLCQAVLLGLVALCEGGIGGPAQAVLGLAVNAASHYWIDRRRTLEGLAHLMQRYGKHSYYTSGEQGRMALDQAAHMGWLLPAALIISADPVPALLLAGLCLAGLYITDMLSRLGWAEAHRTADRS